MNGLTFAILLAMPADPATSADAPTSQHMLAGLFIALGIALMAILIGVSARSKSARRAADQRSPRERIEQIKAAHERSRADAGPLVQHVERIHEFAALLDNKAERIEQLLAEADERIAMLRALNEPINSAGGRDSFAPPTDPLAKSVYELADAGRSSIEIARELDEQVGKVDLILALRGR